MNIQKVQQMTGVGANGQQKTHEGGVTYVMSLKEKLVEFFSLGLLNGNFYVSQEDVLKQSKALLEQALKEDPEFATKAAVYGNNVNGMKLAPTIWLVYVSTLEDKTLFRQGFERIIRNPKMLSDFVDLCRKGGIRKGMGRGMKLTVNEWMVKHLNEYQVSRNKGKLAEVIKVTRPKATQSNQAFMRYLSKGELTFSRAKALKEVLDFMEKGEVNDTCLSIIRENKLQLEELKHAVKTVSDEDKRRLYASMYEGLNYAALMLNLVALERVFAFRSHSEQKYIRRNGKYEMIKQTVVDETNFPHELLDMISTRIQDMALYRKSNMLPFALLNAEKMVVTPEFKAAIGNMLRNVAQEAFKIDPDIMLRIGVDTSGSMTSNKVNESGTLSCVDVATIFASMVKKSHVNTNIFAVARDIQEVDLKQQSGVFEMALQIANTKVGLASYFEQLMHTYNGENHVLLITDSEQADNLERTWLKATRPAGAKLIIWQMVPNQMRISKDPSVVYVCGYSDRLLSLIQAIIENKAGQVEEVEKLAL